MELPPILDVEITAALLRCAPKTVEEALRSGVLPGEKYGEGWIVPTAAFIQVVNENAHEAMLQRRIKKDAGSQAPLTLVGKAGSERTPPALQ